MKTVFFTLSVNFPEKKGESTQLTFLWRNLNRTVSDPSIDGNLVRKLKVNFPRNQRKAISLTEGP
jgi:hypothetical protein